MVPTALPTVNEAPHFRAENNPQIWRLVLAGVYKRWASGGRLPCQSSQILFVKLAHEVHGDVAGHIVPAT